MVQVREIPIFPLPLVMFPGMLQPLHIFEERYKLMIAEIDRFDGCFGIVLSEPHDDDEAECIHTTGTIARIVDLAPLPDGRFNLVCEGTQRFRIERWLHGSPYAWAKVEVLPEVDGDTGLAETICTRFTHYLLTLCELMQLPFPDLPEYESPAELAYQIAAALQIELDDKQQLLLAESTECRLHRLHELLEREIRQLEQQTLIQQAKGQQFFGGIGFSLN